MVSCGGTTLRSSPWLLAMVSTLWSPLPGGGTTLGLSPWPLAMVSTLWSHLPGDQGPLS